jgi:hypothetical protein
VARDVEIGMVQDIVELGAKIGAIALGYPEFLRERGIQVVLRRPAKHGAGRSAEAKGLGIGECARIEPTVCPEAGQ